MSKPDKENPKASKRSKRKPAMEPLGWDEIVSQPGMGGYLSFLNGPIPLPHLQGSNPTVAPDPVINSTPTAETIDAVERAPTVVSVPEIHVDPVVDPDTGAEKDIFESTPVITTPEPQSNSAVELITGIESASRAEAGSTPELEPIPVVAIEIELATHLSPGIDATPGAASHSEIALDARDRRRPGLDITPGVVPIPGAVSARLRIRKCAATHDGHSLGEEVLYQALWKAAAAEAIDTRTIVIGWRGMSQLCRMTPKNCKINTQRLIRKLALEILSPYNTPESIGTTYRVYSDRAIFERRREAGFEWVVRSRGVEFVDPNTGASVMPICAHTQ